MSRTRLLPNTDDDDEDEVLTEVLALEEDVFGLVGSCSRQLTSSSPELPLEEARSKKHGFGFASSQIWES